MGVLRMDIRAALPSCILGVCAVILALCAGCFDAIWRIAQGARLDPLFMLVTALNSQAMFLPVPVIAALPYAASLIEEMQDGFWKYALQRGTVWRYCLGKLMVCWISGAAAVLLGCIGFFLLMLLLPHGRIVMSSDLWRVLMTHALCGGLYALSGMLASVLARDRATAWFAPFLLVYFFIILGTRYFPQAPLLNPQNWPSLHGAAVIPPALTAVCGLSLWYVLKGRLIG